MDQSGVRVKVTIVIFLQLALTCTHAGVAGYDLVGEGETEPNSTLSNSTLDSVCIKALEAGLSSGLPPTGVSFTNITELPDAVIIQDAKSGCNNLVEGFKGFLQSQQNNWRKQLSRGHTLKPSNWSSIRELNAENTTGQDVTSRDGLGIYEAIIIGTVLALCEITQTLIMVFNQWKGKNDKIKEEFESLKKRMVEEVKSKVDARLGITSNRNHLIQGSPPTGITSNRDHLQQGS